jgi:hypothetical protein
VAALEALIDSLLSNAATNTLSVVSTPVVPCLPNLA